VPLLLLVRHASAGDRGSGPEDLARPLDRRGLAQSSALPAVLIPILRSTTVTGPEQARGDRTDGIEIRSSPARRCIETVEPLAGMLGIDVFVDPGLVEGCDVRALHERIATLSVPTVWSSHGDVIPELLAMLARRGLDLGPSPTCRKASTWVLDVIDGTVRSARSLPPPA
jgi:8-oxo-(d)GTP phosphatase